MFYRTVVMTSLLALASCSGVSGNTYDDGTASDDGAPIDQGTSPKAGTGLGDSVTTDAPTTDSPTTDSPTTDSPTTDSSKPANCAGTPAVGGTFIVGTSVANRVAGNGVSATVQRTVDAFASLHVVGWYRVEARVGTPRSVSITADENLVPYLETTVNAGELTISQREGTPLVPTMPILVQVTTPGIEGVSVEGSSVVDVTGVAADLLRASLMGGTVCVAGSANRVEVSANGDGSCLAGGLQTKTAQVSVMGSPTVEICATDELKVRLLGDGAVRYSCSPKKVEPEVLGSGVIESK